MIHGKNPPVLYLNIQTFLFIDLYTGCSILARTQNIHPHTHASFPQSTHPSYMLAHVML